MDAVVKVFDPTLAFLKDHVSRKQCQVVLGCAGLWLSYRLACNGIRTYRLRKAVQAHQKARALQFDQLSAKLATTDDARTTQRNYIVSLSLQQLIEQLHGGRLTATAVLEAFQWKALQAQGATNCICVFVIEAEQWAKDLDEEYKQKTNKPPLFGVPISVKDCLKLKGYETTLGYAQFLGQLNENESAVITVLRELGAIPFCMTTMPQTGFSFGSTNPIYGATTNPKDSSRGPGGSSCGEGALVGWGASVIGLGTDVGGSVRMPAHFCGIAGLKPTRDRVSQYNMRGFLPGRPYVHSSWGPMTRDVESLVIFMKAFLCPSLFSLDPYVLPLAFDNTVYEQKEALTIGYYDFDGFLEAVPACRRAVSVAKNLLEKNGHTLVPFNVPDPDEMVKLYFAAVLPDGGMYMANFLQRDLRDPPHARFFALGQYSVPAAWRRNLSCILRLFYPHMATAWSGFAKTPSDLRATYEKIDLYRRRFTAQWKQQGLDAIICPVQACTAVPYAMPPSMFLSCSYSFLYNMLDYCCGTLPCVEVSTSDDLALGSYVATDPIQRMVKEGCKGGVGLPVGVQVVTLPYREELCLRVMKELEDSLKA